MLHCIFSGTETCYKRKIRFNPLSANPTKMVKHTQTIRRHFADELFECV